MSVLLEGAIDHLSEAVKQLTKAALADDLTPLHNAIALRKAGQQVGRGNGGPDVVVFGDLNRFKRLNDQFGHITGDAAIAHVGRMIQTLFVEGLGCLGFRKSGDEFVLLLTNDKIPRLLGVVGSFAACCFNHDKRIHETSISFGLAKSDGQADFQELLGRAELACQVAKNRGNGELVEWSPKLASAEHTNCRDRCGSCGTRISCDIPPDVSHEATIKVCPVCLAKVAEN